MLQYVMEQAMHEIGFGTMQEIQFQNKVMTTHGTVVYTLYNLTHGGPIPLFRKLAREPLFVCLAMVTAMVETQGTSSRRRCRHRRRRHRHRHRHRHRLGKLAKKEACTSCDGSNKRAERVQSLIGCSRWKRQISLHHKTPLTHSSLHARTVNMTHRNLRFVMDSGHVPSH